MTNEAILKIEQTQATSYNCADGTGIEKGAIVTLSDNRTVALTAADDDICAGIVKSEKIAGVDGPFVSVFESGTFEGLASGGISAGDALITGAGTATNALKTAGLNAENIVGIALMDALDTERFMFKLGPRTINVA